MTEGKEPDYYALYLQKTKRNPKVPKGIHVCPQCDKTYVYFSQLRQHLQRHEMWTCDIEGCDFEYHENRELASHRRTFHGMKDPARNQHPCPICQKSFGSAKEVRAHHRTVHDASGKYPCKHCGKLFFYWQSRKTHQRWCKGKNEGKMKGGGLVAEVEEEEALKVKPKIQPQQKIQPGKRVKRVYRRRKPFIRRKKAAAAAAVQVQQTTALVVRADRVVKKVVPPKFEDETTLSGYDSSTSSSLSSSWASDTPMDLSMRTGKFPTTAFNGGHEIVRKQVKTPLKKASPKRNVATAVDSGNDDDDDIKYGHGLWGAVVHHKQPNWREQQLLLERVAGRQDFLQDVDMTDANPFYAQLCYAAVEQVRQFYYGGYQNLELFNYNRVLAEYSYPHQQYYGFSTFATVSANPVQSLAQQCVDEEIDINGACD